MPVACGIREEPQGWAVGCKLGAQGSRSDTEAFKCRRLTRQDSVMRVASAPSLVVHSNSHSDPSAVDCADSDVLSQGRRDSYQRLSTSSSASDGSPQTCCMALADDQSQLVSLPEDIFCERRCERSSKEILLSPPRNGFSIDSGRLSTFHDIRDMLSTHHLPSLDVVSEESPCCTADCGLVEFDAVSSCSSISEESPGISGDAFQVVSGDTEVQSSYKGPLYCMSSLEASLPVRNGLSRFYSGKSRSFTSLADVLSVKDLAKPENPYARKRKSVASVNSSLNRPHVNFHRSGTGITKKDAHNNKSSLALAVAMGMKERIFNTDEREFLAASSTISRYSSLSGLQSDGYGFSPERP